MDQARVAAMALTIVCACGASACGGSAAPRDPFGASVSTSVGDPARAIEVVPRDALGPAEVVLSVEFQSVLLFLEAQATDAHVKTPPERSMTGLGPRFAAAIDLDGDGRPEIVSADTQGQSLTIFARTSTESWRARSHISAGAAPVHLVAADVDGDGRMELIEAYGIQAQGGGLQVWRAAAMGLGLEKLGAPISADGVERVAAGDLNGDGAPDLAAVLGLKDSVAIFFNDGRGAFSPGPVVKVCSMPSSAAIADLDGDGTAEILVGCREGGLSLISGLKGTPAVRSAAYPGTIFDVLAADLNGDGRPDIAAADVQRSLIAFVWSSKDLGADRAFSSVSPSGDPFVTHAAGRGPVGFRAFDLDGDGDQDLLITCLESRTVEVFAH